MTSLVLSTPGAASLIPEFASKLLAIARVRQEQDYLRGLLEGGALDPSQLETIIVRCADVVKVVEAERKRNLAPVNEVWDEINAHFAPLVKAAGELRELAAEQLAEERAGEAELRADAMRTAAAAHLSGDHTAAANALALANDLQAQPDAKVAVKGVWKARVVDPDKVPREYCAPVQKLLDNKAKSAGPAGEPTPGVEYYIEPRVRVKAKRNGRT